MTDRAGRAMPQINKIYTCHWRPKNDYIFRPLLAQTRTRSRTRPQTRPQTRSQTHAQTLTRTQTRTHVTYTATELPLTRTLPGRHRH